MGFREIAAYRLMLSSGGQAEIILGPYEVIHILAVSR
jgi:hypothetical protein